MQSEFKKPHGLSTRAFVDVAQASRLLRVSEATVRRRCRDGVLPAIRIGREWRVELAALRGQESEALRPAES